MAIDKITQHTIDSILKGTTKTLPDDPSRAGYSPDVIKRRMYMAHEYVMQEINRIVEEINNEFASFIGLIQEDLNVLIDDINTRFNELEESISNIETSGSEQIMYQTLEDANQSGGTLNELKFIKIGEVII